jgi:LTXXQ motif family protein
MAHQSGAYDVEARCCRAGVVTAPSPVNAQAPSPAETALPSEADFKSLADVRIEVVKAALQLTPDQEKLWPAIEEAIRARATARRARLESLVARATEVGEHNPVQLLRERADGLTQRGAALKQLADAWQPLYESLNPRQKLRLRIVAMYVLREMGNALEARRMQSSDEEFDE